MSKMGGAESQEKGIEGRLITYLLHVHRKTRGYLRSLGQHKAESNEGQLSCRQRNIAQNKYGQDAASTIRTEANYCCVYMHLSNQVNGIPQIYAAEE